MVGPIKILGQKNGGPVLPKAGTESAMVELVIVVALLGIVVFGP